MERQRHVCAADARTLVLTAEVPPRVSDKVRGRDRAGLAARRLAVAVVAEALSGRRTLDDGLEAVYDDASMKLLPARDRGLVKALATETLRRLGQIRNALDRHLHKGLPRNAPRLESILDVATCQILFLDVPAHAAVDLAVQLAVEDSGARHYKGLVNAVLRRIAAERKAILDDQDAVALNTPDWLAARWTQNFGAEVAKAIQAAHLEPPPLDITVRRDPEGWAGRLGGEALPGGTIRLGKGGEVTQLAGFAEGAWWVQDVAAALPARLLGAVRERRVADLCAAPGGKTAQLAAAGADVVAVDRSAGRLTRLSGNLERLGLPAETVVADATSWLPGETFEAVLLDAPCSATGTIRRHPDIPWTRRPSDISQLAVLQMELLQNAVRLLQPGGTLVYSTCSLEPEEGEAQVARLLGSGGVERLPIRQDEVPGFAGSVTAEGDLRTLPCSSPGAEGGMDGFFVARLCRLIG